MAISIRRARSLLDYLYVWRLRNANCHLMTGYQKKLSLWAQLKFWWDTPKNVSLYIARLYGFRAGYMLLRKDDQTTYITEVVAEHARRKGVAKALIRYARKNRNKLTANILATNTASIKLHTDAGFTYVSGDTVLRMELTKPRH